MLTSSGFCYVGFSLGSDDDVGFDKEKYEKISLHGTTIISIRYFKVVFSQSHRDYGRDWYPKCAPC